MSSTRSVSAKQEVGSTRVTSTPLTGKLSNFNARNVASFTLQKRMPMDGHLIWVIDGRAPMPEVAEVTAAALTAGYTDARLLVRAIAGAPDPSPAYTASLRAALEAADADARSATIAAATSALGVACPTLGPALGAGLEVGARCVEVAGALAEATRGCDEETARQVGALYRLLNAAPDDQRFAQIPLTLVAGVRPLTVRPTATWAEAAGAAAARRGGQAPGTLVMIEPAPE